MFPFVVKIKYEKVLKELKSGIIENESKLESIEWIHESESWLESIEWIHESES